MGFWDWCRGILFGSPEEQQAALEEERAERARMEAERKRQETEQLRKREDKRFAWQIQEVSRCADVVQHHPDAQIRIASVGKAIGHLEIMLEACPHRTDWQEWLRIFQDAYVEILTASLEAELASLQKRAQTVKTKAAKISAANKALLLLQQAEDDAETAYPQEVINRWRKVFSLFVHHTELETLLMKADKAAFKEEWKKALGAYQDVLYFLTHDDIPDDEQAEQIAYIEDRIAEMREQLDAAGGRPRRVAAPDIRQ